MSTCGHSQCSASASTSFPGGLTRVALGGGLDDRQLLARRRLEGHLGLEDGDDADRAGPPIADTLPPALPDLRYGAWMGQQQQQQQQQPQQQPAGVRSAGGG